MRPGHASRSVFAIAALAAILLPATLFAQEYSVTRQVLLPPSFFVGDPVEMRLQIRAPSNVTLAAPKVMPSSRWVEFRSIQITPAGQEQEVRISFVAYHPGTQPFPPIDLGGIVLRDLSVYVKPAVPDTGAELRPVYGQLLLPNTRLIIGVIVGVLLVVPLLWFGFVRFGRARLAAIIARLREQQPYKRLIKALRLLSQNAADVKGREFYIELLSALRGYFSTVTGTDFSALTTSEIGHHLPDRQLTSDEQSQIMELFRYGDLIKFAGRTAPIKTRRSHIETLESILAASVKRRELTHPGADGYPVTAGTGDEPAVAKAIGARDADERTVARDERTVARDERGIARRAPFAGVRRRGYVSTFQREQAPARRARPADVDGGDRVDS